MAPFDEQVVEHEEQKVCLETRVVVLVHGKCHVVDEIRKLGVLHQSTIPHSMMEDYRYCLNAAHDRCLLTDSRWMVELKEVKTYSPFGIGNGSK